MPASPSTLDVELLEKKHLRLQILEGLWLLSLNAWGILGELNNGLKGFWEGNKGFHLRLGSNKKGVGFGVVIIVAIKDELKKFYSVKLN